MQLIQWSFMLQTTPLGYIFEKVHLLDDIQIYVLESSQYIHQLLGPPTFAIAVAFGFYAHQTCWI